VCEKTVIDADAFHHFREKKKHTAGDQIRKWISRGHGIIVYSVGQDRYASELRKYSDVFELITGFAQRGRAQQIPAPELATSARSIPSRPIRKSNDLHVLALAKVTKATVLFSCDGDLRRDFANVEVLGKVGNRDRRSVPHLLEHHAGDVTRSSERRAFLNRRRCRSK